MRHRKLHRRLAGYALLLFAFLMTATHARATTLADYRDRVAKAAGELENLKPIFSNQDLFTRQERLAMTIGQLRNSLPLNESVLLGSERIEVDNRWLHDDLRELERMDPAERGADLLVERIAERLRALEARINELESGNSPAASKDDSKARLSEILRRNEFNQQADEGNALQRIWNRIMKTILEFLNWLVRMLRRVFPGLKEVQPGSAKTISSLAQLIVLAVTLAVIAYVGWKLVPRYLRNRPKKKTKKREVRVVLGETLEPDQSAADLFAAAESLARNGDLRGAIRKAYIALLCELGDRKLISLAQHKTNRDYLNAVRDKGRLYGSMRPLTLSFENHWYGFAPAGENDWQEFRTGYQQALKI